MHGASLPLDDHRNHQLLMSDCARLRCTWLGLLRLLQCVASYVTTATINCKRINHDMLSYTLKRDARSVFPHHWLGAKFLLWIWVGCDPAAIIDCEWVDICLVNSEYIFRVNVLGNIAILTGFVQHPCPLATAQERIKLDKISMNSRMEIGKSIACKHHTTNWKRKVDCSWWIETLMLNFTTKVMPEMISTELLILLRSIYPIKLVHLLYFR